MHTEKCLVAIAVRDNECLAVWEIGGVSACLVWSVIESGTKVLSLHQKHAILVLSIVRPQKASYINASYGAGEFDFYLLLCPAQCEQQRYDKKGTRFVLADVLPFALLPIIVREQAYLADLVIPYLHAAWVRSQVTWPLERAGVKPVKTGLLTPREQQILQWIYHGKSNIEIGMILEISPLTVKNHVQKTLRKLNVMNRTQAVGKALALRLVNP